MVGSIQILAVKCSPYYLENYIHIHTTDTATFQDIHEPQTQDTQPAVSVKIYKIIGPNTAKSKQRQQSVWNIFIGSQYFERTNSEKYIGDFGSL